MASLDLAVNAPRQGVYFGLENEVYQSGPEISNTGLRHLARSPFHFYSLHLDPQRPPQETKSGQLEGTLAHCAVLEPLEFANRYVCGPDVSRATNEWKAFVKRHEDKTVVKFEQCEVARAQSLSVRAVPAVAELLSRGNAEVSAYWTEEISDSDSEEKTLVRCRCRPDWVHPVDDDSVILVDLKTFSSADAREFTKQAANKAYGNQCAFYMRGYQQATGKQVVGFKFVVVETEFPYAAAMYELSDDWIEMASRENRGLLHKYAHCVITGEWPSYPTGEPLHLPSRFRA